MKVPSGATLGNLDLHILRLMAEYGFVQWKDEPLILNSGILSHMYVYGREDLTDNPDLAWLIGRKLALAVKAHSGTDYRQPCLIGIPTAGTALAQAASFVSYNDGILVKGNPICYRIMREALKKHGAHRAWVNGVPNLKEHVYWTIDNVVTDGQSKIEAATRLQESGYPALEMPSLIFVDRQQGGIARLKQYGFQCVEVIYYLLDIVFAFGELGLWPKEKVRAVEEEIKAHQFIPHLPEYPAVLPQR